MPAVAGLQTFHDEPDREVIPDKAAEQLYEGGEYHYGGVHDGIRVLRVDGGGEGFEEQG